MSVVWPAIAGFAVGRLLGFGAGRVTQRRHDDQYDARIRQAIADVGAPLRDHLERAARMAEGATTQKEPTP